ncbi:DUF1080 domain-containing protein [Flavobacteriaceae bacterium TP-CH-4]|uniref:DUF1080 domain-containing protein n=1 Tax=Pelagihabitans pacificus TaxID=2696054 RepID=A0A967E646_9FLAO|nr:DUF1080 domain-containing protein [Pelagihabitans pacificus]NHF59250.1 DUF1080 domain-containing protein [Pelagihabitans pacificus]
MNHPLRLIYLFASILSSIFSIDTYAQETNPLEGRWNLIIEQDGKELPSWLEITHSGNNTLVGRFVYAFGSARPIAEVKLSDGKFSFTIPPQWEPGTGDMQFEGMLNGGELKGTMVYTDGNTYNWTGSRSPKLAYNENIVWGKPIALFNGKDLSGWHTEGESQWAVEEGVLKSPKSGVNLISDESFSDFKLHVEFRYPEGSNSGIYLRGRYEVQIADNKGLEPASIYFGGVYGFLDPNEMVAKEAGQWQTFDITLIGRRVTIVANGSTIVSEQNIPGMTGGAMDNREAEPGPILIQGDHGPIEFKSIVLTPAKR